jgi:hypothetical protein
MPLILRNFYFNLRLFNAANINASDITNVYKAVRGKNDR